MEEREAAPGAEEPAVTAPPAVGRGILRPRTILSFLVAFAVLAFFFRSGKLDFAATWARMRASNWALLLLAFAVYYATFVVRSLRWRTLLANVGYSRASGYAIPSLAGLCEILYLSWFTNCVVPARLGDAYRGYMLRKSAGVSFTVTLGTILAERLIDVSVLAVLMTAAALVAFHGTMPPEATRTLAAGLVLTAVGIVGLVALPRLRPLIDRVLPQRFQRHYAGLEAGVLGSFRRIPVLLGYSIVAWLIEGLTLYIIGRAVGAPISPDKAILVALAASLLSTVPFTPAGLGVAEAGMVLLLRLPQIGLEQNTAAAVALLDRAITYGSIVIFGAVLYIVSRKK